MAIKRTFCTCPFASETADDRCKVTTGGGNGGGRGGITMSPRGVSCPNDGQLSAFLRRYTEDFRRFVKFVCTHRKHTPVAAADLHAPPQYFLPIPWYYAFIRFPIVRLTANIYYRTAQLLRAKSCRDTELLVNIEN